MRDAGRTGKIIALLLTAVLFLTLLTSAFAEPPAAGSGTGGPGGQISIQVVKYAGDHVEQVLAGAEFALYDENGAVIGRDGKPATFTTDDQGIALISGDGLLQFGQPYYLREIDAPAGYALIDRIPFMISDAEADHANSVYANHDIIYVSDEPGIVLKAKKWVQDRNHENTVPEAGAYSFTVQPGKVKTVSADGSETEVEDELARSIVDTLAVNERTAAVDENGEAVFNMPMTLPEGQENITLHFEISEVVPDDAVRGFKDGIRYDTEPRKVTVTIVNRADEYSARIDYENNEESATDDAAVFVNRIEVSEEDPDAAAGGKLQITKILKGNDKETENAFAMELMLSGENLDRIELNPDVFELVSRDASRAVYSFTIGENAVLEAELPAGTGYEVREVPDSSDEYAVSYENEKGTISAGSSEPIVVTVTNERNTYGALTVSKELRGNAANPDQAFRFRVTFTGEPASTENVSFSGKTTDETEADVITFQNGRASEEFYLLGGQTRTYIGIPNGVHYEVEEDDYTNLGYLTVAAGSDTGRAVGTVAGTSTVPEEASVNPANEVRIINTRDEFGELRITQTASGNMGELEKEFHFVLEADVPDGQYGEVAFANGRASFTLKDSHSVTVSGLPNGTVYTISENEANQDHYVTTFQYVAGEEAGEAGVADSIKGTIDAEVSSAVSVVNSRSGYGGLVIEKRTAGSDPDRLAWFAFRVALSGDGAAGVNGQYGDVYFINGVSAAPVNSKDVDYQNGKVPANYFKVVRDEPVVITGLPAGLRYTVEEADCWTVYDREESSASNTAGLIRPLVWNCGDGEARSQVTRAMIEGDSYTFDGSTHVNKAVFVNVRNRFGTLEIRKAVAGEGADPEMSFRIRVTMRDRDGNPLNYRDEKSGVEFVNGTAFQDGNEYISLKDGASLRIQGLPLGAAFEVNEDDYAGQGFQAPVYRLEYREDQEGVEGKVNVTSRTNAGTIGETQRTVTVTNTTGFGSLRVEKSVLLNGQPTSGTDADGEYFFILERKNSEGVFETVRDDISVTVVNGQSARVQVDRLVPGTYRVREDGSRNPAGMRLLGEQDFVEAEVAADNEASIPTASFTNSRIIEGTLSLTAKLEGGVPESLKDAAFSFVITLTGENAGISGIYQAESTEGGTEVVFENGRASVSLKADETLLIMGLPEGAVYSVSEKAAEGTDFQWENSKNSGTISSTEEEKVVCVNRLYGSLTVLKTLQGNNTEADHVFHLVLRLTDPEGIALSGEYGGLEIKEGTVEFDLRGGQSRTFRGLPNGTRYSIREAQSDAESAAYISENAEGIIEGSLNGSAQTVEIVSTRNTYGGLVVMNLFSGSGMEDFEDRPFRMTVTFAGPAELAGQTYAGLTFAANADGSGATDSIELKKDEKKVYLGLPNGIAYTLTGEDLSTEIITAVPANAQGTIQGFADTPDKAGEDRLPESNFAVMTHMRRDTGILELKKEILGNAAKETDEFEFEVQLGTVKGFVPGEYGDMTFDENGKATVRMHGGEVRSASGLPNGTKYKVTEKESSYIQTSSENAEGEISTEQVSSVKFVNTKNQYGALSIEKQTDGNDPDRKTWFEFRVTVYTAEGAVDESISGTYGEIVFEKGVSVSRVNDPVPVSSNSSRHEGWFTVRKTDSKTGEHPALIIGLPAGSRYTVDEYDYSDTYQEVKAEYASGTIEALAEMDNLSEEEAAAKTGIVPAEPNRAVFTNIRNITGKLRILKDADVGEGEDGNRRYEFRVTLRDPEGRPVSGEFSGVAFDENGVGIIHLKAGFSKTLEELPKDTRFKVEEVLDTEKEGFDKPSYTLTAEGVSLKSNEAVIESSSTYTVTVKNQTRRGALKLTKSVLVNGKTTESTLADGEYSLEVTNEKTGYKETVVLTVKDGAPATKTLANLVPGIYTVKEIGVPPSMVEVRDEDTVDTVEVIADTTAEDEEYKPAEKEIINDLVYSGNLKLGKTVTGTGVRTKKFDFGITLTGANGQPVNGTFTTDVEGLTVEFKEGTGKVSVSAAQPLTILNIPAGIEYRIEEVSPAQKDGYIRTNEARTGKIENQKTATEIFQNVYRTEGFYTVEGLLETEGGAKVLKNDEIRFMLSRQVKDDKTEAVEIVGNREDGTFAFSTLKFNGKDLLKDDKGLFTDTVLTYTVSQVKGEDPSLTYDTTVYEVKLTLKDNGKGEIEIEEEVRVKGEESGTNGGNTQKAKLMLKSTGKGAGETAEGDNGTGNASDKAEKSVPIRFVNQYAPTGSYTPEAFKVLLGRSMNKDDVFEAELLDAEGKTMQRAEADWHTGRFVFSEINYTLEDMDTEEGKPVETEKTYMIREVQGKDDNIRYDGRVYTVHLLLKDNGEGQIVATPSYDVTPENEDGTRPERVEFANRAMRELRIRKELSGFSGIPASFSFTVKLKDVDGTGMTGNFPVEIIREKAAASARTDKEKTEEYEVVRPDTLVIRDAKAGGVIRLKAGETAVIGGVPFEGSYEIMEGDSAGYVRAGQKDDKAEIKAEDNLAVFINKAETDVLTLQKLIYTGDRIMDEKVHKKPALQDFVFTVELSGMEDMSEDRPLKAQYLDAEGKVLREEEVVFKAQSTGGRLIAEGIVLHHKEQVRIEGIPVGATYKVTEAAPVDKEGEPVGGYTSVLSSLEGVMVKTNASGQKNEVVWKNQYASSGKLELSAEKLVNGRVPQKDGEFTFVLENHPDKRFESTPKTHLEAADRSGKVLFGALEYTLEDDGNRYGYRVYEKAGSREDMVYDRQVYTVEVFVEDDGQGNMITRVTRLDEEDNETSILFRNTEVGRLFFSKTIEGGRPSDVFYFNVKLTLKGEELTEPVKLAIIGQDGKASEEVDYVSGKTIELLSGQTAAMSTVPTGTTYAITEERDGRYITKVDGKAARAVTGTIGVDRADHAFVNTQVNTEFSVTKVWADGTNGPINLVMYANDKLMDPQPEIERSGNTYSVKNLPRYDRDGNVVTYSARERRVSGYVAVYTNVGEYAGKNRAVYNGGTITNSQATSMTIRKVWSGLREGETPPEIELTLLVNGDVYDTSRRTPDAHGYYHWYNLPLTWKGERAVYSVVETELPGFVISYENYGSVSNVTSRVYDGGTITNTAIPKTGDSQPLGLWMILCVLSLGGIAAILTLKRRKQ